MSLRNQKCFIVIHLMSISELYLEELSHVPASTDIECQTDTFLDKPATPLFIPAKSGIDATTQIEEGEVDSLNKDPTKTAVL